MIFDVLESDKPVVLMGLIESECRKLAMSKPLRGTMPNGDTVIVWVRTRKVIEHVLPHQATLTGLTSGEPAKIAHVLTWEQFEAITSRPVASVLPLGDVVYAFYCLDFVPRKAIKQFAKTLRDPKGFLASTK